MHSPSTATEHEADGLALEVQDLTKRFGHVQALRGVSFAVRPGEVVGLVGDNGAGKSTVIKILAGTIVPDSGHVLVNGVPVRLRSTTDSRRHGIETVYQDLALAPDLNAVENFFLGREIISGPRIPGLRRLNDRRMRKEAPALLGRLSRRLPALDVPVRDLSGGQRQIIAIGRALTWADRVVLMDEPTAALGVQQTEEVFRAVGEISDRGIAVVVISHNLPELLQFVDRIVTLRLGAVVDDAPISDMTVDRVLQGMTGLNDGTAANA